MSRHTPEDYGVSIVYSHEDESHVATCPEFPGLTGFGDTQSEALADIHEVLIEAIDVHKRNGYPLPEPQRPEDVVLPSGEFRLRIPRFLHYQLAEQARHEGVSLNHLASNLLQDGVTRRALVGRQRPDHEEHVAQLESSDAPLADAIATITKRLPLQEFKGASPQQWQTILQSGVIGSIDVGLSSGVN